MRLIDADRFKNLVVVVSLAERCGEFASEFCKLIDSCPTAYDVDKVVECLEEIAFYPEEPKITRVRKNAHDGSGPYVRLEDAAAVVKAGMDTDAEQKEGCSTKAKKNMQQKGKEE